MFFMTLAEFLAVEAVRSEPVSAKSLITRELQGISMIFSLWMCLAPAIMPAAQRFSKTIPYSAEQGIGARLLGNAPPVIRESWLQNRQFLAALYNLGLGHQPRYPNPH
jgi:hypothetical protein